MARRSASGQGIPAWKVLVVFVIFAIFVFFAVPWWFSDKRIVRNRLSEVAATLSAPEHETELHRFARIASLRRYLAEDIRVRSGSSPELTSRDAVLAVVTRSILPAGLTVEFVDVQVTLEPEGAARVYLTAKLMGRDPRTNEPTIDAREANLEMTKRNSDWLITSVEAAETLQRP